jgi:uncharacterized protein
MSANGPPAFEQTGTVDVESPTLIEGFPGLGLVASIAVDQITTQLDLEYFGQLRCPALPPVASYDDGRVQDLVRVYAGDDPAVMTLQSDLMIPPNAFDQLSECVLSDLATEFARAIFLAGAPARNEEEIGEVIGIATTDAMESEVVDAGIELAEGSGLVGGITGALVNACYEGEVPAAVLVAKAHPQLPDPGAARSVIENALEPLVDFNIDTTDLQEQSEQIRAQLEQIAQQYRQMTQEGQAQQPATPNPSMYQ